MSGNLGAEVKTTTAYAVSQFFKLLIARTMTEGPNLTHEPSANIDPNSVYMRVRLPLDVHAHLMYLVAAQKRPRNRILLSYIVTGIRRDLKKVPPLAGTIAREL